MSTITKEQFIQWSFERDWNLGLLDNIKTVNELLPEEKEAYEEEADYYLSGGYKEMGWPEDIVDRAKRENVELPS